jgi:hypothetical protein
MRFLDKEYDRIFLNIDLSRVEFTSWRYLTAGVVIKVKVHGKNTVVEEHSQANPHPTGTELDRYLYAHDPHVFEPKH